MFHMARVAALVFLLAIARLTAATEVQWSEVVGGSLGTPISGTITDFDYDQAGSMYVVTQFPLSSDGYGSMAVWRVSRGAAERVYVRRSDTRYAGCRGYISLRDGRRQVLSICGNSTWIADLDSGESVDLGYMNQPFQILNDGEDTLILAYASIWRFSGRGLPAREIGGDQFTCEDSATRMPLARSMAMAGNRIFVSENVCYGIGSVWEVDNRGSTRLTSFIGDAPDVGQSIVGKRLSRSMLASIGNKLIVYADPQIYIVNIDSLDVLDSINAEFSQSLIMAVRASAGAVALLNRTANSILQASYRILDEQPSPTFTPTNIYVPTSTHTPAVIPTTAPDSTPTATSPLPTFTSTQVPTATAGRSICEDLWNIVNAHCR